MLPDAQGIESMCWGGYLYCFMILTFAKGGQELLLPFFKGHVTLRVDFGAVEVEKGQVELGNLVVGVECVAQVDLKSVEEQAKVVVLAAPLPNLCE
jgi:hypothetical protein